MKRLKLLLLLFTSLNFPFLQADELPSFPGNLINPNPLAQIHGLSGYSHPKVVAKGEFSTRMQLDIVNEFRRQSSAGEQLFFDFERTRLSLGFEYGLANGLSAGVEIPFLINSGGFLDGLIEGWHDVFGLPQGGRDDAPQDRFMISYQGGNDSLGLDQKDQGIGDVSLFLDKQLIDQSDKKIKAGVKLKLPSGDEQQLFGSAGYGLSINLNGINRLHSNWHLFGAMGFNYLEEGDVLPARQERFVATATAGIGWRINPNFNLSAQLNFNSKVYDKTDLDAVSAQAGVLNLSMGYRLSDKATLNFGFSEDVINKDGAPDFAVNLRFDLR